MFKRILMTATALFMLACPVDVNAQSLDPYYQTLADFNRIKPFQNPNWERSSSTLKSKIQDSKNKVVGELNDIIVTPDGAINALNVELNRLQLGDVFLNYRDLDISASARAYSMGFEDDQIEEFYPELVANIETAAGNASDSISMDALVNSDVMADDGRRIGKVEEVMFSERGDRAEALIIRVNYRTVRGETVAVPFSSVTYVPSGSRFEVMLADQQANTILEFAEEL